MIDVQVTQYLRPDGRKRVGVVSLPDEFKTMVNEMKSLGMHFTGEQLETLEPVTYITHPQYGDYDIEIGKAHESAMPHFEILRSRWNYEAACIWVDDGWKITNEA